MSSNTITSKNNIIKRQTKRKQEKTQNNFSKINSKINIYLPIE